MLERRLGRDGIFLLQAGAAPTQRCSRPSRSLPMAQSALFCFCRRTSKTRLTTSDASSRKRYQPYISFPSRSFCGLLLSRDHVLSRVHPIRGRRRSDSNLNGAALRSLDAWPSASIELRSLQSCDQTLTVAGIARSTLSVLLRGQVR